MSKARDVVEWNLLRRQYKKDYSVTIISALDASGLISKVLKANKA